MRNRRRKLDASLRWHDGKIGMLLIHNNISVTPAKAGVPLLAAELSEGSRHRVFTQPDSLA
jgi:hypothetical protein